MFPAGGVVFSPAEHHRQLRQVRPHPVGATADVILSIRDLVNTDTEAMHMLYQQLKYRHLSSYAPFHWSLINRLLDIPLLEDRRPSVLIYSMLSLLPQGEPAGSLFLSLFLRRRPLDMRDQMSTRQTADLLWDTCGHPHVTASGTALALLMSTNLAAFSPAAYLRRPSSPYPHRRWSPSRWSRMWRDGYICTTCGGVNILHVWSYIYTMAYGAVLSV